MIVILHGMPDGQQRAHDIPVFQESIDVRVAAWLGMDEMRCLGKTSRSVLDMPRFPPTEHVLEFRFTHYDGSIPHYEFTGLIDGV